MSSQLQRGASAAAARERWRGLAQDGDAGQLVAQVVRAQRDAAAARAALERLLVLCRPVAEQIARTYIRSEADAADVVQEALVAVARHLPELREPAAFPHWFAALTHNACRQWLRRERRRWYERPLAGTDAIRPTGAGGDFQEPGVWELAAVHDPSAGADFDVVEARDLLYRLLRTLPGREREVVRRVYLDEQPQRDVGRRMDLSTKAIENLLYRALRRLRTAVDQCGADFEELALWCQHCGAHRLRARLQPGDSPSWPIRLRAMCPRCAPGNPYWINLGLPLDRYPTLEGALMEGLAALGGEVRHLVRTPEPGCGDCGRPMTLHHSRDLMGQLTWECRPCRMVTSSGVETVAVAVPAWRAFWRAAPRLRLGPKRQIERNGETRIELTAHDPDTGRTATLAFARDTLDVRAVDVPGASEGSVR